MTMPGENGSMSDTTIGLLHPGEMGAAVGQCLTAAGHRVLWVPEGRSAATRKRAAEAGWIAAKRFAHLFQPVAGAVWPEERFAALRRPQRRHRFG